MKPRRSKHRLEDESRFDEDEPREDRPRRARRPVRAPGKRRKLLVLLVVAAIVIGLLPMIVAKTPLRNVVLSAALPTSALRISAGEASLGWFSTPSLTQVRVFDSAGDTLAMAESINIDRAPVNLLVESRHLGLIEIVRPSIYLKIRADGNNIEDVLRQALAEVAHDVSDTVAPDAPSQAVEFAVQVVDGTIFAEDATTGRRWRVQALDLLYDTRDANGGLGRGQLSAQIADVAADNTIVGNPGQFAVAIQPEGGKQQLTLQANALSLGLADAWLRQYVTGSDVSGTLSGQGTALWTASGAAFPSDFATSGAFAIERLDATAPALAGDRIRLALVEVPWRLTAQPDGVKIELLQLRSDVGQLAARGTIDPAAFLQAPANGFAVAEAVAKHEVELRGSLDLVRLAAMLPHALKIRDDTKITSGSIELAARSQPANGGQVLTGSLQTSQLAATSGGRPFRWDQPVSANFALRREHGALRLESLKCDSDFLKVDASGTPQQMSATAQFDLNRLAEQLGKFIDSSGMELAGTGAARLDWRQTAPNQFSGAVTGEVAQLRIVVDPWAVSSVQSTLAAELRISGEAIEILDGKVVVTDSRAVSPGWNVHEPRAELSGDLHWNRATGEISTGAAQLVSSAVSIATKEVRYRGTQQDAGQPGVGQFTGMAAFRVDVARLATWRAGAQKPPAYQPSGELSGNARFIQQAERLTGEVTVTGKNLALAEWTPATQGVPAPGYKTIWQEPQISVRGLAAYESATDRLAFEQFKIQSNTLEATAAGQIEKVSTAADIKVNGTLNYDLAQITPLLAPYLGSDIQLTGREQAQFELAGQMGPTAQIEMQTVGFSEQSEIRNPKSEIHWSRRVQGRLEVPWAGANVYGLPIGAGRLSAALGNGMIHVEPLALAVGEGRLTAAPSIRLDPEPSELTLPQGPLITNVRISPEVSEALLKFVAPVLAGATQSDGQFSLALDGGRVPLRQSKQADAAGQLTVHSVRVVPGPMAKQCVELAQQIESLIKRRDAAAQSARPPVTLLSVKDQQVNFRVVDGRVHHQNMEFQVGDVTLRSQGSVGLDETVALTLSVPVQDAWIAKEPLLSGFKGQSLAIPISGTLTRPKMDERAIASITQQLLQGAAQQAIGGELNKALDKLFKSR